MDYRLLIVLMPLQEEKENLSQEIDRLSAQVEALKKQRTSPRDKYGAENISMAQALDLNVAMRTILRTQQQMLIGANAMLVDWMVSYPPFCPSLIGV